MQLYKIKDDYLRALDDLSTDESLTPEMIEDSLSLIKEEFNEKALNIGAYIKNLQYQNDALNNYYRELCERQLKITNKIDRLKEYLKLMMQACDIKKVEGIEFDVSLRNNPAKVIIEDEEKLGNEWFKEVTERKLLKDNLKEALKEGKKVEGAHLEQGVSLIIK